MNKEIKQKFIGTWKLESVTVKHEGYITHPYGRNVKGIVFYTEKFMGVQIMQPVDFPFTENRKLAIKLDKLAYSLKTAGYLGYWGTYSINTENHTIIHHVKGSISQPIVGGNEIRKYKFSGDKLILSAGTMELVWNKIE